MSSKTGVKKSHNAHFVQHLIFCFFEKNKNNVPHIFYVQIPVANERNVFQLKNKSSNNCMLKNNNRTFKFYKMSVCATSCTPVLGAIYDWYMWFFFFWGGGPQNEIVSGFGDFYYGFTSKSMQNESHDVGPAFDKKLIVSPIWNILLPLCIWKFSQNETLLSPHKSIWGK